ncbi:MAG: PadR family transcriptional regulator [Cyclobacteriaceae bacterium]|nr:PadR family transcriptional regulator [Cyclobacteriaceae bacterium]
MKGTYLGEFEEVVLLSIAILGNDAYGISIKDEIKKRLKREPSIGALHSAFSRLEEKGFIDSREGETAPERGGRRKLYYCITKSGVRALEKSRELRNSMWNAIPSLIIDWKKS